MRTYIALAALLFAATTLACQTPAPRPTGVAAEPGLGDSLAKLLRRQLTDSDPVALQQAMTCEAIRLSDLIRRKAGRGSDTLAVEREIATLLAYVTDTVYKPSDGPALRRVDSHLGGHVFSLDDPGLCPDSIITAAPPKPRSGPNHSAVKR